MRSGGRSKPTEEAGVFWLSVKAIEEGELNIGMYLVESGIRGLRIMDDAGARPWRHVLPLLNFNIVASTLLRCRHEVASFEGRCFIIAS
jgi:hypothetical protein